MEKWYMYRHPKTGDEVKIVVTPDNVKRAQLKKLKLSLRGYKCLAVIDPITVTKCKEGSA
ncbi:hypothetical protein [Neobacillus sp. NPDC093127]|uniref:hypothetical protein n=1 Tax=Neobacillus sp. NPDC093127 TaxID=3364296 RepID=UPI003820CABD